MATSLPPMDSALTPAGLSQGERLMDTFYAPSKTFTDIRRSAAWWLPFLLAVIVGYCFMFAVQKKVGWPQVVQNSIQASPKQAEQIDKLPADQQQAQLATREKFTKMIFMVFPVVSLLSAAILTGLFMLTINFAVGGVGTYKQYFAVWMYAGLPLVLQTLLTVILLFAGGGGEGFHLENPVGTNLAFYFSAGALPAWLSALLTALDIFTIWTLVLLTIGYSIVGRVSRGTAGAVVFGWWGLWIVIKIGLAAAFS